MNSNYQYDPELVEICNEQLNSLQKNKVIMTEFADGPFKFLNNRWSFVEDAEGCLIDFNVEFEFKSTFLQKIIIVLFNEAVERMVGAFEDRANALYKQKDE